MGVRLQFEGIRCFYERQVAEIRPITLLVGENSSGKTTFLALCNIAHAMVQGAPAGLPFNEYPFSLGAFEQIASKRNGSPRSKSFSLTVSDDRNDGAELTTEFVPREGQPWPSTMTLAAGSMKFQSSRIGTDQASIVLEGPEGRVQERLTEETVFDALAKPPMRAWSGYFADLARKKGLAEFDLAPLELAQQILRGEFPKRPYAFAPIRTSPRRTYDPVTAEAEPEGSHVPMLMATLARSAPKRNWQALQASLAKFGAGSGLFSRIEIVNKGKKEGDPFQIGVKSRGPVFNLIDVGYGVSQALPILVDTIQRSSGSECFLLQQPEVHLHPRAQAELGSFFAREIGRHRRFVVETHSDHLVDRIRMEVRRKHLKPEQVSLLYFERDKRGATIYNLELDKDGSIADPPPGYRQFFLNEERGLLDI